MGSSPKKRDGKNSPPPRSTVLLMFGDLADTTWRMFVPSVGGMWLGALGDDRFGTRPWIFAAGTVIGISLSALLIKQQLQKVNQNA